MVYHSIFRIEGHWRHYIHTHFDVSETDYTKELTTWAPSDASPVRRWAVGAGRCLRRGASLDGQGPAVAAAGRRATRRMGGAVGSLCESVAQRGRLAPRNSEGGDHDGWRHLGRKILKSRPLFSKTQNPKKQPLKINPKPYTLNPKTKNIFRIKL